MGRLHIVLNFVFFLYKHPKILIVALLSGGLFYSYEVFYARDTMSFMGVPQSKVIEINTFTRIFRNDAYMVGYSDIRANPLWVVYKLEASQNQQNHLKRLDHFSSDWRNFYRVTPNDYTNSGYDRGHMAPNHAIALLYGKKAQEETFLMSNITPQKPSLNQKKWQELEMLEVEEFMQKFKTVWVYTGPLFDKKSHYIKNSSIEIPDAFFKIYVGIEEDNTMRSLAFIMPQSVKTSDTLKKFIVTIREVEERSGFDFFHQLDDVRENTLETTIESERWL